MRATWGKPWLVLKVPLKMHLRHLSEKNLDVLSFFLCLNSLNWLAGNSFTSSAKFLK